ncbi:MAG: GNAT family N-acetyltransferase [Anaerolineaceae bacterium]
MIQLRAMTDSEFLTHIDRVYIGYADEQVIAGSWPADRALKLAKAEINDLLPDGLATQDHFLYSLIVADESSPIGTLWIMIRERNDRKEAFIDDIEIFESFRRRGYAAQALNALEDIIKGLGIHTIRLQVFGHNLAARELYEKCGYDLVNIYMEKQI